MRPTIDEQLSGVARLLGLAESDPEIPPGVAELVRNARRLVNRVGESWSHSLPYLREDNARLAEILGVDESAHGDLSTTAAHNEELRGALTTHIRNLPPGAARARIGVYLRDRVATNPT